MIRQFKRAFSTAYGGTSSNLFDRLRDMARIPIKHIKRGLAPGGKDQSPMTNTTEEAFDEVSQEWQALVVGNPYDVNTFNMLEQAMMQNFGTVDNPHVVFTSDAPFRYVGCSGLANEDDYEGHEFLMFMLREGALQRCPTCGQVYKLVRLRNEFSPEMDYYISSLIPYQMEEFGEMDTTINMSLLRFQKDTYEYSQFETPSHMVYRLINPDQHDRLLTDPAYRMEVTKESEDKYGIYASSLQEINQEYEELYGQLERYPINKIDYETLIDAEKAILKLDRLMNRSLKFYNRKFIDTENHERREQRMRQRAQERAGGIVSQLIEQSEIELQYRDYFETDLEDNPENETKEEFYDEAQVMLTGRYDLNNFDFQERYTFSPVEDAQTYIQKKLWKFKYRIAAVPFEDHLRKEERMLAKSFERLQNQDFDGLISALQEAQVRGTKQEVERLENDYYTILSREGMQQYQDYFESEDEDMSFFDSLSKRERMQFVNYFQDPRNDALEKVDESYTVQEREAWNNEEGFWSNVLNQISDVQIKRDAGVDALNNRVLPMTEDYAEEYQSAPAYISEKEFQAAKLEQNSDAIEISAANEEEALRKLADQNNKNIIEDQSNN